MPSQEIVFVVDDDVSVRESLEGLIRSAGWQAETYASARQFLARGRVNGPCCLVLDISLPDLNGLDLQKRLAGDDRVDMPIIFITGFRDIPMTVRAMKAGALEFLIKPFENRALLKAIRVAMRRSRALRARNADKRAAQDLYASLTPREREVMGLVVSGLLNKQVARRLGISEVTVKVHRGRVMRKMKAASFAALVKIAGKLEAQPPFRDKTYAPALSLRWPDEGQYHQR